MGILDKICRSAIYHCTKKTEQYVHVDKHKSLQDYRQIQYNNWCKVKGVYNGSYLPNDGNTLIHKGWKEVTSPDNDSKKNKAFQRKSTGQVVRFDFETENQIAHYYWRNPNPTKVHYKMKTIYLDRYGKPCTKRDPNHHLAPLDKDCPKNAEKKVIL